MTLSYLLWASLKHVPGRVAAAIANAIYSDRRFGVDRDGDWICRQPGGTIASPDIFAKRWSIVEDNTQDGFLWDYSPKPDDIVVDVGAGVGEEALVLGKLVHRVIAIEAHPVTFRCLSKSVRLSAAANVEPVECALADVDGHLYINDGPHHVAASVSSGSGHRVKSQTLSSICEERGIKGIAFLKMNIEGAERLAINGLGDIKIERLAISCHDFVADVTGDDFCRTKALVHSWLVARGYEVRNREDHRPALKDTLYARRQAAR